MKEFSILEHDAYLQRKSELIIIAARYEKCQDEITSETEKADAIKKSLMSVDVGRTETKESRAILRAAEENIGNLTKSLRIEAEKLILCERELLKHLAALLKLKTQNSSIQFEMGDTDIKGLLEASEARVAELEAHSARLERSVSRLEAEQKATKQAADGSRELNRLKLDHSKIKSALADVEEELLSKKDSIATLQLQFKKDQDIILNKDRIISNLMAEIEELQACVDINKMGGYTRREHNDMATLRRMITTDQNEGVRGKMEMMSSQLEDALQERDRMQALYQKERDKNLSTPRQMGVTANDQFPLDSPQISAIDSPQILKSVAVNSDRGPDEELKLLLDGMNSVLGKEPEPYTPQAMVVTGNQVLEKVEKLRTKLKSKYADLNVLKPQLVSLSKRFKEKDNDLEKQSKLISDLEKSKADLQFEILKLEDSHHERVKKLEAEISSLKSKLQESEESKISSNDEIIKQNAAHRTKLENLEEELRMEKVNHQKFISENETLKQKHDLELQDQLKGLEMQIELLEKNLERKTQSLESITASTKNQQQLALESTKALESQIGDLKSRLEATTSEKTAIAKKQIEREKEFTERLNKKDVESESVVSEMRQKIADLNTIIKRKDEEYQVIESNLLKATSDYQDLKHEIDALHLQSKAQCSKSKDELFELNRKFSSLSRKYKDCQHETELYRQQCEILEAEVVISKQKILDTNILDTVKLEKDRIIAKSKAEIESLLREIDEKDKKLLELTNDGDETLEELERLQNMLFDVKSSRADLLEQIDDYQHEIENLKREIKNLRQ